MLSITLTTDIIGIDREERALHDTVEGVPGLQGPG
jgi:hypothetical protein